MTVLEGPVECRRHADGRVEILAAPPVTRISLNLLAAADPMLLRADGNRVTLAGQVVYRVTGWDAHGACLVAEMVEDRRAGVSAGGQAA